MLKKYYARVNKYKILFGRLIEYGGEHRLRDVLDRIYYKIKLNRLYKANTAAIFKTSSQTYTSDILISIVVPLFNTPENYLREMIDSVRSQNYLNWELCLVDASEVLYKKAYICNILKKYYENDKRIRYVELKENEGISENTNRGFEIAQGQYITLLDHDDVLHKNALYDIVKCIEGKGSDFIYTDELTFVEDVKNIVNIHYKSDFALETLRCNNYICHLSTFKKALLDEVGGLRKEFDGSQDYDLILRLTEKAKNIYHIPKVLYFWRAHEKSVAANINAKPYATIAAKRVLEAHLKRNNLRGEVESVRGLSSVFNIRYELSKTPLVSIILIDQDGDNVERCIASIEQSVTYPYYELIVSTNKRNKFGRLSNDKLTVHNRKEQATIPNQYNEAVEAAKGEYIIFLKPSMRVKQKEWIENLLRYAQREDVSAVGPIIYFDNNKVKNGGIYIDQQGKINIPDYKRVEANPGYMGRMFYARNVSILAEECIMVKKEEFYLRGKFNEKLNNYYYIDFCLKCNDKNIIITPLAKIYSCNKLCQYNKDRVIKHKEYAWLLEKWDKKIIEGDKFYNASLCRYSRRYK